jgi:hypothetical protein
MGTRRYAINTPVDAVPGASYSQRMHSRSASQCIHPSPTSSGLVVSSALDFCHRTGFLLAFWLVLFMGVLSILAPPLFFLKKIPF